MASLHVPSFILRAPPSLRPLLFLRYKSSTTTLRAIEPHLPRIAQPALWKSFIPRFMRRDPSNLLPPGHKYQGFWSRFMANPASGIIILGMLTGNAAIHIIRIKREMTLYSRKADQKIELLREVIERVQKGEDVDVEKILGTGDPKAEEEWFDVIREIENEQQVLSRNERQRQRREARREEEAAAKDTKSPANGSSDETEVKAGRSYLFT